MPKKYTISDESPVLRASVDRIRVRVGDDPVELTQDQVKRLEDAGVILEEGKTSNNSEGSK